LSAGSHCLAFEPARLGLANGPYYFSVRANGADGVASVKNGVFLILR
jgi:hypothetical protein